MPYEPCAAEPVGMCGLQTLYLWGACMGSVEECAYGLAWDVNEMHMGICVCVLKELHSLHIGESREDVCEGLPGTGIGCPTGMYGGCRGVHGAAALPCIAPVQLQDILSGPRGLRAAPASPTPRACLGPML